MKTQVRYEIYLNTRFRGPFVLKPQRETSEPLPPREGIRFVRGSLWGIALCLPVWMWILWAVAGHL
jgi:hypothetical protein